MKNQILIVDGYSTARHLVSACCDLSIDCVHIRSEDVPPNALATAFSATGYTVDLGFLGTCHEAAKILKKEKYIAVVPGSEPGVEYAEELARLLDLPSNTPDLSFARRNKVKMAEAVARAGLRSARHSFIVSESQAIAFARQLNKWPIVVKPVNSAGSDGVHFCNSEREVKSAVARNLGRENLLGIRNDGLMVQEFLNGRQFFFNTVSCNGKHVLTDGWERRTRDVPGYANVLEDWILVDPQYPKIQDCIAYSLNILDALGIENGAAVTEVRLTDDGPVLVETGARLNGPTMEAQPYLAAGLLDTQATAMARRYAGSARFVAEWKKRPVYELKRHAAISFFIFTGNGVVAETGGLNRLEELKSWNSMFRTLQIGDPVSLTTDTVGRGGFVYWVHDDQNIIKKDLSTFRGLEASNLLYSIRYEAKNTESAV